MVVEESIAFVVIKDDEDRTFLVISTKKNKIAIVNISAKYIYIFRSYHLSNLFCFGALDDYFEKRIAESLLCIIFCDE